MSETQNQRLAEVAAIAVRIEKSTGLPAEELIAQWALESQWGGKPAGQHNYFGIKKADRHQKDCVVTTREVIHGVSHVMLLVFADYDSLEESCLDFAWLITHGSPYAAAWHAYQGSKNLDALLAGVAKVYATDPYYGRLIAQIAHQDNVRAAIAAAKHGSQA